MKIAKQFDAEGVADRFYDLFAVDCRGAIGFRRCAARPTATLFDDFVVAFTLSAGS